MNMSVTFRKYFQDHPDFQFQDGLFCQTGFQGNPEFVRHYLQLRLDEGRVYDDETVLRLPEIPVNHPVLKEWIIRKRSTDRLIKNLGTKQNAKIVEIGCGNGWLIHYLSKSLQFDFCGININEGELKQAVKLFGTNEKINFVYADIYSELFRDFPVDVIILAGVVQYFSNLKALINRLLTVVKPEGEIHILDSPFYSDKDSEAAKARGDSHYEKAGHALMKNYYFYHRWNSIQSIGYKVLYDPSSVIEKIKKLVVPDSPFPWIKITKI